MTSTSKSNRSLTLVLLLSAGFFALFLAISGALYYSRGKGPATGSKSFFKAGAGAVGVLEVEGVIMDSRKTLKRLKAFEESDRIKAVVLRLNSPGGAVAPSQEIYQAIKEFKKPIVASMGSVAASGAYYIACGTKTVFANPGTITGSIGVIMEFANLEKLYDWAKIQRYSIKSGKFKDTGSDTKPMTEEERTLVQTMVNDVLVQFKGAVQEGRKMTPAEVTAVADGRIFSGSQAKEVKLVDQLGTFRDAIKEAAVQGKISGEPDVVYPERPGRKLIEYLMDDGSDEDEAEGKVSVAAPGWIARLLSHGLGISLPESKPLEPGVYWLWKGAY